MGHSRGLQRPNHSHFLDVHLANHSYGYSGSSTTTTTTTTTTFATPSSYLAGIIINHPKPKPKAHQQLPPLQLRTQPREESTRIQLQRQRIKEQHTARLVSPPNIPGIKTSAAFFASLRTNLRLHASPPPSPISTPNSLRGSIASLPPPSPLSALPVMENDIPDAPALHDPMADVPALTSYLATDQAERTEALRLVADSVAQQRQSANRTLIFHPLNIAVFVAFLAVVSRLMRDRYYDWAIIVTTYFGLLMTVLVSLRMFSQGYIRAAEKINWDWAGDVDVLLTKFGDEVIGVVLIEWLSGESRKKGKKAWQGLIRAWTVKLRYRHKGVGVALLEDAVKEAKKKGAESLEFADDHANSTRILPSIYNGTFDKSERNARELLQDLLETSPVRKRKS